MFGGPDQNIPGADGIFDDGYKLGDVYDKYLATTPDTEEPRTGIVSGPDGVWVNIPTVTFEWEGADDRTPPEYLGFSYSLDDAPWTFEGYSTWFFEDLAEGQYTFAVRARDGMGFDDPTPAIAR